MIVFVLWFPFVQECVRVAVTGGAEREAHLAALGKLVYVTGPGMERPVRLVMWLCDQLAWWWIIIVLLAVLGTLALNSALSAELSRVAELSITVPPERSRTRWR